MSDIIRTLFSDTTKAEANTDLCMSIGEMNRNGIQYHATPDDPDSVISLLRILQCCLR